MNKIILLAKVAPFICALGLCVSLGISKTVKYAVGEDAAQTAIGWSNYLVENIPELSKLIETGVPTEEQSHKIEIVSKIGNVFRFKLFDNKARLVLISDNLDNPKSRIIDDHNGKAALVLKTGENQVSLNDGMHKSNRPDLYAEAYVPIYGHDGGMIGVAEVYVDETSTSGMFHRYFNLLAIVLTLVLSLAFFVPYAAFLRKASQEVLSRNKANYLAEYDQTANLLNRSALMERLKNKAYTSNSSFHNTSVIYLGVDHFKVINDTYGHAMGDAFLRHLGASISRALSEHDLAGRMGGDEFMIVVERDDPREVYKLIENIKSNVATPLRVRGTTICGQISLGVFHFDEQTQSIEEGMQKSEIALYDAKFNCRNCYRVYSPEIEKEALHRRHVETSILSGCEEDRFELHFQPLLHQATRECAGFEALLRLKDVNGNNITPDVFIPVAEAIGAINKIGLWVLENALQTASEWPEHYFVSVNLSARQFDDETLVASVEKLLKETNFPPSRLELEVTERLLIENAAHVSKQLSELQELGVSIAMDDFGTGYSSLGYLWQFGFDKLKIDRSFISGLNTENKNKNEKAKQILDSIIMLGHRLGMRVTAEGIETEEQASILSALECDQFQGYLYGKPMGKVDLAPFILKHQQVNVHGGSIESIHERSDKLIA